MGKLKTYQQQIQDIVDKGINAAEEQQKKLASKPFQYAEKLESEAREYSVKNLHNRYNGYSESLFEQLRSLNNRVGGFAANLVARVEKETVEGADSVSKAAHEAADEVSETAESAKKSVEGEKAAAKRSTTKSATAKKGTAAEKQAETSSTSGS
ncbi:MAG: hypothetical protein KGY54_09730 [Oleiphilaceae bacterium]|nr:hypothetical protein [Oleiphilaceae bacterium]